MTPKAKQNLEKMEKLGFNVMRLDYDSCIELLINKYIEVSMACEYNDQDYFKNELLRVTRNKTN